MAEITLAAETGRTTGSRPSNRLRREDKVPGVVYGHGSEPVSVSVDRRDLRGALTTDAGLNALINLELEGERKLTIVKELQRDPVRRAVTHVDFLLISRDEELEVDVPIVLAGDPVEVERNDGVVEQVMFSLTIKAKPGSIPNELVADVSGLDIGGAVRVGDLELPAGVATDVDADETVVLAQVAAVEPEPEPEEVEGEEGELAEGEGGAEAAAEGEGGSSGGDDSGEG
jgi:large subunit ribosomal protein L25